MTHKEAPPGAYLPGTQLTVGSHAVTIRKYISEGGFAHVYTCDISPEFRGSSIACLKRVAVPDKPSLNLLRSEVDAMKRLAGNEYIVQYIDSHAARNMNGPGYEVFLLMEYCSRHGLIDFMNERLRERLTEAQVLTIGSNIAEAVFCMHYLEQPLLHRDLKIENVLISGDGKFKLCDFGSVSPVLRPPRNQMEFRILDDDIQRHTTVQYRSPEMVDIMRGFPIDEKSDIWALGVFFYKLCYYITPFEHQGQMAILNAQFSFPNHPQYSDGLKHLISVLLREDPRNRPNIYQTIQEICRLRNVPVPDEITQVYYQRKEERRLAMEQGVPATAPPASGVPPSGVPATAPASIVASPSLVPQQAPVSMPVPHLEIPSSHSRNHSQTSLDAFDPDEAAARYPTVEEITRSLEKESLWEAPTRGVSEHAFTGVRDSYVSRGSVPPSVPSVLPTAIPTSVPQVTNPVNIPFKAKSASPPVRSYKSNNPYLDSAASSDSSDEGGLFDFKGGDSSYREAVPPQVSSSVPTTAAPVISSAPIPVASSVPAPVPGPAPLPTPAARKPLPSIPIHASTMPPPRKPARPTSLYMRQNSSRTSIVSDNEDIPSFQFTAAPTSAPTSNKLPNDHDELQAILTGLSEHETTVVLDDPTHHHIDSSVDFLQEQQRDASGSSWKLFRSISSGSNNGEISAPRASLHRRAPSFQKMLHKHHRHSRETPEYGGNTDSDADTSSSEEVSVSKRSNRWSKSFESLTQEEGLSDDDERGSRINERNRSSRDSGQQRSLDAQRFEKRQEELRASAKAKASSSTSPAAAAAAAAAASKASVATPARKSLDLTRVESSVEDDDRSRDHRKSKRFSRSESIQGRIHALINRRPSPPRKTASGYGKYTESTEPPRSDMPPPPAPRTTAPPPRPSPKPVHLQSPKTSMVTTDKSELPPRKPTRVMTEDDDWKASFNEKYPSLG